MRAGEVRKIAYHTPQIDVRGSCTAVYDYATHMRSHYGIDAVILFGKGLKNDDIALQKFSRAFKLCPYDSVDEIDDIVTRNGCDYLYCIKYGKDDGLTSLVVPTGVHCVFDMSEPHGDAYVAVSESLARKYFKDDFVPHMISLKPSFTGDNMRVSLGIPRDAIVFGRHGGRDTFDLVFAMDVIKRVVRSRSDIYFVFVNTPEFDTHPQIKFIDKIIDNDIKNRFIHTCDAHIEAGSLGHTFGISIGEFSVNNKPIIAYNGWVWNRAHIDILGDRALYFKNEEELYDTLTTFDPSIYKGVDLNCYKDYSPKAVISTFKKVFIG